MGMKASIAAAVANAFLAVGDLKKTATYVLPQQDNYSSATGEYVEVSTTITVDVVLTTDMVKDLESDGVQESVPKVLVQASEFSSVLSTNGIFIIEGSTFNVISWDLDPAGALYTVKLSRGA